MSEIETDEYVVQYNDDDETKQAVFDRLIEYFKKHESFSGESVCQCDEPIIDAPYVIADIADNIIKFKARWKYDETGG